MQKILACRPLQVWQAFVELPWPVKAATQPVPLAGAGELPPHSHWEESELGWQSFQKGRPLATLFCAPLDVLPSTSLRLLGLATMPQASGAPLRSWTSRTDTTNTIHSGTCADPVRTNCWQSIAHTWSTVVSFLCGTPWHLCSAHEQTSVDLLQWP